MELPSVESLLCSRLCPEPSVLPSQQCPRAGTTGRPRPTETRSSWSGQTSHFAPVSSPAGESPGVEPGLGAGYLVLIVVAVFALVTGAAALLVVCYQRMTGKYNFRTQSDNFSYQVFSE